MKWTKSPRGAWVAHDGRRSYEISRLVAYERPAPGRTIAKNVYVWRLRIDGAQVGGAGKCAVWNRVADAKAYAEDRARS